jgi:hypothetical protein
VIELGCDPYISRRQPSGSGFLTRRVVTLRPSRYNTRPCFPSLPSQRVITPPAVTAVLGVLTPIFFSDIPGPKPNSARVLYSVSIAPTMIQALSLSVQPYHVPSLGWSSTERSRLDCARDWLALTYCFISPRLRLTTIMTVMNPVTLASLLSSKAYLLAYSLPLLVISVLLTFCGAFLTLDRTRSFSPSYERMPGAYDSSPKRRSALLVFEGGVGGLTAGFAFGSKSSTFCRQ